jgi:hypothetical protein
LSEARLARIKFYQNGDKIPFIRIRFNATFQTLCNIKKGHRFILTLTRGPYLRKANRNQFIGKLIRTSDPKEGFSVYSNTSQFVSLDDTHTLSEIKISDSQKNIWYDFENVGYTDSGDINFRFKT